MGDTSKSHKAGQFTDFFLTGANDIFTGFTTDFVKRAWDVDDDTAKEAPLDTDIKNAGNVVLLNTRNLPFVGQATYIVKGSGRLQAVGVDGKRVLETILKAGNLLIVPRFFVVSKIADSDGLSWFSIITTPNPVFTHLAGRIGAWKAISPEVLQAAFKVPAETEAFQV
ncbi:Tetratricopeptide repeat-like superfamily protein [Hibiscus syriacus]|uniref:Tetratricopeptide repeat-like superfamily protein n=1 Tax=Hibiscus syriacus TaxID=106335 RepID=A0A6A2YMB1_HIBSY|nr:Tetratricopeptide repeat-like superfamily protein [Hibiscus syriacus]